MRLHLHYSFNTLVFLSIMRFRRFDCLLILFAMLSLAACNGGGGGDSGSPASSGPYLSWLAPSEREDGTGLNMNEIAGYRVYYGEEPGVYTATVDINDSTMVQMALDNIPSGTYYVVVTAVDTEGRESELSSEVIISH